MPRLLPQGKRSSPPAARLVALVGALAWVLSSSPAWALKDDKDKPMKVNADYSKMIQSTDAVAGVSVLRGKVTIVQGSMKSNGDDATIYQHPNGAKDAQGNDISGGVKRVVMVGKQAHLEQVQDSDKGLMLADADKVDYDSDTGIAIFTGNVHVVQQGRSEFHGTAMTYNTNTGEMESGDNTAANRVTMTILPKAKPDAPTDAKPATVVPPPPTTPGIPTPKVRKKKSPAATGPALSPMITPAPPPATTPPTTGPATPR